MGPPIGVGTKRMILPRVIQQALLP
jgi:hypothetical protein